MNDLISILANHRAKKRSDISADSDQKNNDLPEFVSLPNVLFDSVLVQYKLSRIEFQLLIFLYRQVYCKANLYKDFGISQVFAHTEISQKLNISINEIYTAIKKIEDLGFITTIRSGQYFVRKYFTKELDSKFKQTYDDF